MPFITSRGDKVQACKQDSGAVGLCDRLIGPPILSLWGALACEIEVEWAGKPDSVRRLSPWAFISLGRRLPAASSGQPGTYTVPGRYRFHGRSRLAPTASSELAPYLALLRAGFSEPVCHQTAGALLPHLFTLTPPRPARGARQSGLVSVPLSVGSPRLGVTQRPALWSPDFPRPACANRERLAHSNSIIAYRRLSTARVAQVLVRQRRTKPAPVL